MAQLTYDIFPDWFYLIINSLNQFCGMKITPEILDFMVLQCACLRAHGQMPFWENLGFKSLTAMSHWTWNKFCKEAWMHVFIILYNKN